MISTVIHSSIVSRVASAWVANSNIGACGSTRNTGLGSARRHAPHTKITFSCRQRKVSKLGTSKFGGLVRNQRAKRFGNFFLFFDCHQF